MNILFLTSLGVSPFSGGVERFSLEIGNAFCKIYNYQPLYLSLNPPKTNDDETRYGFFERYLLPSKKKVVSDENIKFVKELILKNNIDILFNQQSDSVEFIQLCAEMKIQCSEIKIVSILHFDPLHYINIYRSSFSDLLSSGLPLKTKISYAIRNFPLVRNIRLKSQKKRYDILCEHSDAVVLLSDSAKQSFSKLVKDSYIGKLHAICNPLTTTAVFDGELPKENIVLFVGRVEFLQKRVDLILKIWKRVSSQKNDWQLVLVGDGTYMQLAQEFSRKENLQRVSFVGYADSELYYKNAKILCMTSNTEGFGLVLTEASSYGVVPFAFDSFSTVYDIIQDGKNGCIIPAFDVNLYAEKLLNLMNDPVLLSEMSRSAKKHVEKFSIERIASQWKSLFDNLLNSK